MANPNLPASVLAQRGVPISLLDGRQVMLCFTFSSLMLLEEAHGSMQNVLKVINEGISGAVIGGLIEIIGAGLEHEHGPDGERYSDPDVLRYVLDPQLIGEYGDAIGEAFEKAFPQADPSDTEADPTQPVASSHGETGTTSPPSPSVEATASSAP
jgi:hypothetical protein